ncbi:MAG: hypothetical protein ABF242_03220 [Flavobacteriales bacterium]
MEILYYLIAICVIFFMAIAVYDGIYLHLWKYQLHTREESYFEHKTHTVRAILFPLIVWFLFVNNDPLSFWIGIALVVVDFLTLSIDAFSEKDSRKNIGGLPRWEYIIHLFANGFHFAAIVMVLGVKLTLTETGLEFKTVFAESTAKAVFDFVAIQAIPGAVIMGLLHVTLAFPAGRNMWQKQRLKVTCC